MQVIQQIFHQLPEPIQELLEPRLKQISSVASELLRISYESWKPWYTPLLFSAVSMAGISDWEVGIPIAIFCLAAFIGHFGTALTREFSSPD